MWLPLSGILFTTMLLVVPVLLLVGRWRLPIGSLTLLFGLLALSEAALSDYERPLLALGVLVAGPVGDLLVQRRTPVLIMRRCSTRGCVDRLLLRCPTHYGVGWVAALWTGAIVLSAIEGIALSLMVPAAGRERA